MNLLTKYRLTKLITSPYKPSVFVDDKGVMTVGLTLMLHGQPKLVFAEISNTELENWAAKGPLYDSLKVVNL